MKKILFVLLWFIILPVFTFANDSVNDNCADFEYWKLCVNIKNNYDWTYEPVKIYLSKKNKDVIMINCKLLLPNWIEKDLWSCTKKFEYIWTGNSQLSMNIFLEWETKKIKFDYNFWTISSDQLAEIKTLKSSWSKLINKLTIKYPKLKSNKDWKNISDKFYNNIENMLNWYNSEFQTYQDVVKSFKSYIKIVKLYKN